MYSVSVALLVVNVKQSVCCLNMFIDIQTRKELIPKDTDKMMTKTHKQSVYINVLRLRLSLLQGYCFVYHIYDPH